MARVNVTNPTHRGKAVRSAGGLLTIKPNGKVTLDPDWTEDEVARYEAAGLVIKPAPGRPAKSD